MVDRSDRLRIAGVFDLREILADRLAGDGERIGVETTFELLHQRGDAAGLMKFDADGIVAHRLGID